MSTRGTTFMGFGIRIDIMSQAALFAFKQLTTRALMFVGAITQVADELLKFEKVMADLSRLMVLSEGTTANLEQKMAELGQTILGVSNESVFNFTQVAEALNYLMRAGYNASEALDQLEKAMLLATAVGMDLAEASKTLVRLENMFAYAGQDVANIVDQLAQSEMLFAMTTEDMNTALNMAGAVAAEAGISLAELATMIGVLYSAGLNASTAGTVLRRAIAAVLDVSSAAGEAIAGLGVDMDYFSTLVPLDRLQLLAEYITAIEDPQTRLNVAFEIFGIRGVNILPVLESMVTDFDELAGSIQNAEGIAITAAEVFREQLYTQLVMLQQAIQNNIVNFGLWVTSGSEQMVTAALVLGGAIVLLTSSLWGNVTATIASYLAQFKLNIHHVIGNTIVKMLAGTNWLLTASEKALAWAKNFSFKQTMKNIFATLKDIPGKLLSGGVNLILSGTYGILSMSIKVATLATKAFFKALGPIGLLLSLIAAVIMVVKDQFGGFGGLLSQFQPIINQLTDFFKYFGQIIMEVAKAIMPLVSILLKSLMFSLKMIIFPLRILMVIFKVLMLPIKFLAILIGEIAQKFTDWIESTGIMNTLMEVFGKIMTFVWKIVALVLNIFIALANAIIWVINLFRGEDNKIEYLAYVTGEEAEGMMEEASKDTETKDEPTPPANPDETEDYDDEYSPTGPVEPTGSSDEGISRGSGGGGGTGDSFLLNIYIVTELSELLDEVDFAETLARRLAIEMKSSRGVYL